MVETSKKAICPGLRKSWAFWAIAFFS
jgi:hypothetical protein